MKQCVVGKRSRRIVLSLCPSVWKREEFGDLLRSRFFKRCVAQADNQDRDVDLYH